MGNCQDCKFWSLDEAWIEDRGRCGKVLHNDQRYGPTDPAVIVGSRSGAWLETTPDFGCLMHEPKA